MIRWLINKLNPSVGIVGMIIFIILIAVILAWISGCITYFLLSVAFPQYIKFNWYLWQFIALGFLYGGMSGLISYKKKER